MVSVDFLPTKCLCYCNAALLNSNDECILCSFSKSEFVIYKLKEMGKISEKDILQICKIFDRLDAGNCGKIMMADLIYSQHN